MLSDETEWLVSAGSEAVRLPVCVYGTLRSGQAARDRLLDGEDIAAMAAARISDHRLMVASPDSARWGGCAMAVPAAGESVVAELVVLRPETHDEVLAALDTYEFAGYSPTDPRCPYARRRMNVLLPLDEWGIGSAVTVPAWVYLPNGPLRELSQAAQKVIGGDWCRWDPDDARQLVGAAPSGLAGALR